MLITGVTGYLASHVCLLFLQDGRYRVRATVRDKSDALKMDALYKAMGDENFKKMEIVEAELLDTESLERAVEGCEFVIHVASPVPRKPPKDENAVIRPAVEGTLTLLRASK